jgi:hypothetical protein
VCGNRRHNVYRQLGSTDCHSDVCTLPSEWTDRRRERVSVTARLLRRPADESRTCRRGADDQPLIIGAAASIVSTSHRLATTVFKLIYTAIDDRSVLRVYPLIAHCRRPLGSPLSKHEDAAKIRSKRRRR